jgi:hypothetical protein
VALKKNYEVNWIFPLILVLLIFTHSVPERVFWKLLQFTVMSLRETNNFYALNNQA